MNTIDAGRTGEMPQMLGDGETVMVTVMPIGRFLGLFSDTKPTAEAEYRPDFSISRYRAQFEPDLSESRIRELCAGGAFPDSTDEAGDIVPGAYKNSKGEWQITMEGILARQRRERADGIKRRKREEEKRKEERHSPRDPDQEVQAPRAGRAKKAAAKRSRVARPNKGKWKEACGSRSQKVDE